MPIDLHLLEGEDAQIKVKLIQNLIKSYPIEFWTMTKTNRKEQSSKISKMRKQTRLSIKMHQFYWKN